MNKYGIAQFRHSLGETDASIANDATGDVQAASAAYLADSGATLILNYNNGTVGTVTLTANVTAVKIWYAPTLGSAQTMTVKITQHASSPKTISYGSNNIYSDGGSTTKNGSILWSGGATHVMSTANDQVDVLQFTCIPTSATDRDVYACVIGQNFS